MSKIQSNHWLRTTRIAHRGLWGGDVAENSLTAYRLACEASLAIEIDVYMTTDGHIVVFHDDNLKRMTGVDKLISDCTLDELKLLRLNGGEDTIPTLEEVFAVCEGKAPLLIEIKSISPKVGVLEGVLLDLLRDYKGDYAVQSFNPYTVRWFKENAPDIIRGQLATYEIGWSFVTKLQKFMLKHMMFEFMTKPQFISYDERFMPNSICKKAKKRGKVLIAWTVKSQERQDELMKFCDNVIFENYI